MASKEEKQCYNRASTARMARRAMALRYSGIYDREDGLAVVYHYTSYEAAESIAEQKLFFVSRNVETDANFGCGVYATALPGKDCAAEELAALIYGEVTPESLRKSRCYFKITVKKTSVHHGGTKEREVLIIQPGKSSARELRWSELEKVEGPFHTVSPERLEARRWAEERARPLRERLAGSRVSWQEAGSRICEVFKPSQDILKTWLRNCASAGLARRMLPYVQRVEEVARELWLWASSVNRATLQPQLEKVEGPFHTTVVSADRLEARCLGEECSEAVRERLQGSSASWWEECSRICEEFELDQGILNDGWTKRDGMARRAAGGFAWREEERERYDIWDEGKDGLWPVVVYHYTSCEAAESIAEQRLFIVSRNMTTDASWGPGVYVAALPGEDYTAEQMSAINFGNDTAAEFLRKCRCYFKITVQQSRVRSGREQGREVLIIKPGSSATEVFWSELEKVEGPFYTTVVSADRLEARRWGEEHAQAARERLQGRASWKEEASRICEEFELDEDNLKVSGAWRAGSARWLLPGVQRVAEAAHELRLRASSVDEAALQPQLDALYFASWFGGFPSSEAVSRAREGASHSHQSVPALVAHFRSLSEGFMPRPGTSPRPLLAMAVDLFLKAFGLPEIASRKVISIWHYSVRADFEPVASSRAAAMEPLLRPGAFREELLQDHCEALIFRLRASAEWRDWDSSRALAPLAGRRFIALKGDPAYERQALAWVRRGWVVAWSAEKSQAARRAAACWELIPKLLAATESMAGSSEHLGPRLTVAVDAFLALFRLTAAELGQKAARHLRRAALARAAAVEEGLFHSADAELRDFRSVVVESFCEASIVRMLAVAEEVQRAKGQGRELDLGALERLLDGRAGH